MKYILASSSPRRRELLDQIGLKYTVVTCDTDEGYEKGLPPDKVVKELSARKAEAVYRSISSTVKGYIAVIAADTVVAHNGKILGKPENFDNAVDMLRELSGDMHSVYTGVSIIYRKNKITSTTFCEKTDVYFRSLTDDEIIAYVKTGEPMDKAGAYGIQGRGAVLVERINGDYFTIVGLPLTRLYTELAKDS